MPIALAPALAAVASAAPDREAIVHGDLRRTWREVAARAGSLGRALHDSGLGPIEDPAAPIEGWRCPQDRVALYLHNGAEYLEAMLAAFAARAVPVNVNYRYGAEELAYLFADAAPRAVVFHGRFAERLNEVGESLPDDVTLIQVEEPGHPTPLLAGAWAYEELATAGRAELADLAGSCDPADRYILYTGGTTGMPKGVLWHQSDFATGALGVRFGDGEDPYRALAERAARRPGPRALPAAPFMHGAAHWSALSAWLSGGTVVLPERTDGLDAADVLATAERERATSLLIVGDAFARPLVDALATRHHDLSALRHLITGGAILSTDTRAALLDAIPGLEIVDILGSSESGRQAVSRSSAGHTAPTGHFEPGPDAAVVGPAKDRLLSPGDDELGWLAQRGAVPTGYLGDEEKTEATFPVIDGVRWSVPGDRARWLADGTIELHGRESVTINTGGEKVFAEEVEHALKSHPAVYDAVVVGRPSPRWGQEVVAVIQLRHGRDDPGDAALTDHVKAHLAGYKAPRAFRRVDRVERSPAGKADYRWARDQFAGGPAT